MATLNTEWHGVAAGTQVKIIDRVKFMQTQDCVVVERVDGEGFPTPYGYSDKRAIIAVEYVTA